MGEHIRMMVRLVILWSAIPCGCAPRPGVSIDTSLLPSGANCSAAAIDGGRILLGQLVHLNSLQNERIQDVLNGTAITSFDGGYCVRFGDAVGPARVCFDSGRCQAFDIIAQPIQAVRQVDFGLVAVGQRGEQSITVVNSTSERVEVTARTSTANFSAVPNLFVLQPLSSRSLSIQFSPAFDGPFRDYVELSVHDGGISVVATGIGGGPFIEIQPMLDAGFVTQIATRRHERRRLWVRNVSTPGNPENVFRPGSSFQSRANCRTGRAPRLSFYMPQNLEPGESAWFDLMVEPLDLLPIECLVELRFGSVWLPLELSATPVTRPIVVLGFPLTFPPDGGLDIDLIHNFADSAYLSWPRLEEPDGGLELVLNWSEAILPANTSLRLFVRQTSASPLLPNAILVDGNIPGGARFEILRP